MYRYASFLIGTMVVLSSVAALANAEVVAYRATFDMTWGPNTHQAPPGAHFSNPVGSTHNAQFSAWEPGQLASPGIQSMAETGNTSTLAGEINAAVTAGNSANPIFFSGGFNSPGKASTTFQTSSEYSLLTLVTMIAPSPDWFVGIHGFDLSPDERWISKSVIDLLPYDAGTDDGLTFTATNAASNPHVPISRITVDPFPNALPLGTLTLLRIVAGDFSENGELDVDDIDALNAALRAGISETAFDLNLDGLVNADDRDFWVRDLRKTYYGDANLDGLFNTTDLITAFQAGTYEDSILLNATWQSGDWNGDGEFTSADLVTALADGGYDQEPRAATAVHAVPEPKAIVLAIICCLTNVRLLRLRIMPRTRRPEMQTLGPKC
ncbi:MAG: spondin domain-containing protein [Planctomycetales bacterium]|nr:spondin domain-containing protein [Planctomycetales bacterium]